LGDAVNWIERQLAALDPAPFLLLAGTHWSVVLPLAFAGHSLFASMPIPSLGLLLRKEV
jgi:hypothetical protein